LIVNKLLSLSLPLPLPLSPGVCGPHRRCKAGNAGDAGGKAKAHAIQKQGTTTPFA
jgi:hypothetical protein